MQKFVYADNAGTTRPSETAREAMLSHLAEYYGNPSSICSAGRKARRALEEAREAVAEAIHAGPDEIFFVSGGTEADNWAIRGALESRAHTGRHIITSAVEHHAVLHTLRVFEQKGWAVTYLPADARGLISPEDVKAAIRDDTALITIIAANNEIGTILPVAEIGGIARARGILFHTDAVQAVGHIPVDVRAMGVDMLSMSGHKLRGYKGTGALYIKKGLRLPPILTGGGQEKGRRSGTENVAGICAMAAALREAALNMDVNMKKVSSMRDRLIDGLLKIPCSRLTGDPDSRLPGIASFVFEHVEGESVVLALDNVGVCAASGSVCASGSPDPSHVLTAIGLPREMAYGSIRLSLETDNTEADVDYILDVLPGIIEKLRAMSPLWEDKSNGET